MSCCALRYACIPLLLCATAAAQQEGSGASAAQEAPEEVLAVERALRGRLDDPLEELDLDLLMLGEDFFGARSRNVRWGPDSLEVCFSWKRWDQRRRGTWCYDVGTGELERLPDHRRPRPRGVAARGGGVRVYAWRQGIYRAGGGELLLQWTRSPRDLVLDPEGEAVLFRTSGGIFRLELDGGRLLQLLALEGPEEKDEEARSELERYHRRRERRLLRGIYEAEERRKREEALRSLRREESRPIPVYRMPEGWKLDSAEIAPSGTYAAFLLRRSADPRRTLVPDYVTPEGYTDVRRARPKVGDEQDARRLEVVELATGESFPVKEPAPGVALIPASAAWSPKGRHLLVSGYTADHETVWLLHVDPKRRNLRILHRLHDPAWTIHADLKPEFLGRSTRAFFMSEASGWSHLYVVDAEDRTVRQLTKGSFEVRDPQATPSGDRILAVATPTSPHVRDLVAVDPDSGAVTLLTADGGGRGFELSPDGSMAAEVHSRGDRPWELRIRFLDGGRSPVTVTRSPSPAFESYGRWEDPEIVHVPCSDGVEVPARIYRPGSPAPGRPAVLFVHGAGYLQNVHHWWSHYFREYGFHHLLRDEGYLVLDMDYRGSAGYGRDWRTAIYGHMGGRDLQDHVDAARWLVAEEGVSEDRIGIYGGSYGGFLTLMALFRHPGVFQAGAALRPVTDWAHYNHWYTSRILDGPLERPGSYRKSSPIEFAEGLQDHLLICHGLLDTNVHAQDVFRLQQRLIELRKRNWQVVSYPLEGHGFKDAAAWSDEYHRIKALFDRVLKGPR